jgi:hypothetical protein
VPPSLASRNIQPQSQPNSPACLFLRRLVKCKATISEATPAPVETPLAIRTDNLEKKIETPKTKKRKTSLVLEGNSPSLILACRGLLMSELNFNCTPCLGLIELETPSSAVEMSPPPSSATDKKASDKKQKIVKQPKVKTVARVKGPLDLDKQCGVIVAPGGTPCARSLTCKSHSMSSKRSVEGRSRPYDVLLGLIQKKPLSGMYTLCIYVVYSSVTLELQHVECRL